MGGGVRTRTSTATEESDLEYKVVETSDVTAETLELVLNQWVAKGWRFEGMQFVVKETARRPSMAFVIFVRAGIGSTTFPATEKRQRNG